MAATPPSSKYPCLAGNDVHQTRRGTVWDHEDSLSTRQPAQHVAGVGFLPISEETDC